eukprot:TRINITY_DN5752_c0_g1_i1.p1 TRINITY_DN5752_c0_g1~~TRINITY_DN5752_c0_g1_i1.p1  ORF type:complete len:356 (-),score=73.74 TRINITY_DN5752_c0_g1_i1:151-1218(-)
MLITYRLTEEAPDQCLEWLESLRRADIPLSSAVYSRLLLAFAQRGSLVGIRSTVQQHQSFSLPIDSCFTSSLVASLASLSHFNTALDLLHTIGADVCDVLDELMLADEDKVVSFSVTSAVEQVRRSEMEMEWKNLVANGVLAGYLRQGDFVSCIGFFYLYFTSPATPDHDSWLLLLQVFTRHSSLTLSQQLFDMLRTVHSLSRVSLRKAAACQTMFDTPVAMNLVTRTLRVPVARRTVELTCQGPCLLDERFYVAMMKMHAEQRDVEAVEEVFMQMLEDEIFPSSLSFSLLLELFLSTPTLSSSWTRVKEIYQTLLDMECPLSATQLHTISTAALSLGDTEFASRLATHQASILQ